MITRTKTTATADGRAVQTVTARLDGRSVLTAVRAFYLDIAQWADDDPARWGRCGALPGQRQRRLPQERPLPPQVPDGPADPGTAAGPARPDRLGRRRAARRRPAAAGRRGTPPPGALFTAGGQTLRRPVTKTQPTGRIWAEDPDTGKRRDLTFEEHRAFWTWAVVEVLRHTGIRIEELTELSHHSLIQYRLPATGELIPLLQIAPSKTDAERLLVISPELADVLSAIIRRIRGTGPARAAGGRLRQARTRLEPADAAAVPAPLPAGAPRPSPRPRCASYSTTR